MNAPKWLKPGLYGAVIGALALGIAGFAWGGWVTGGTAKLMAHNQAKMEVIAALVPICLEKSKQDPMVTQTMAKLKDAASYNRSSLLMKTGWATMPGSDEPNRGVATACMDQLTKLF